MAMAEQVVTQERAKLIVVTRFDGERVAQEAKPEPKKRTPKKLPKVLSREEVARIFKAIKTKNPTGLRNYTAYILMYRCGLRVSEAINLSVKDVNFETAQVYVQQGKGHKDRYVPLDDETIEWCKKWLAIRPDSAGTKFLSTLKGTKLMYRYFNQSLWRLGQKAGVYIQNEQELGNMHNHIFRHCYATELLEEGYNLIEVQQLLGHASLNMVMIYAHLRPGELGKKIKSRKSTIPQKD